MARSELGPGGRTVATCLAAVWIAAGVASIVIGPRIRPGLLSVLVGALAVAYGCLWVEVAVTGRRRGWPLRRSGRPGTRS